MRGWEQALVSVFLYHGDREVNHLQFVPLTLSWLLAEGRFPVLQPQSIGINLIQVPLSTPDKNKQECW